MQEHNEWSKVTVVIDKESGQTVLDELKAIGLDRVNIELGRTLVLKPAEGLQKLLSSKTSLVEDSAEKLSFLVPADQELDVMTHLVRRLHLDEPGRGSIYVQSITVPRTFARPPVRLRVAAAEGRAFARNLMGIDCITQKGEANSVAVIGLNTGTALPLVTFGVGTGLRNRLGLWRILVPAEKEISSLVVDASDAGTVMEMMIAAGQLDQPGKGFISLHPIRAGLLNTRFSEGKTNQAASVEQMVSALDDLKGGTEWRRKGLSSLTKQAGRNFLEDLVTFAMFCNQGYGESLTAAAMEAGATGATICQQRHIQLSEGFPAVAMVSPAREVSLMTVGHHLVEGLLAALEAAGLFQGDIAGEVHLSPVPRAFTYIK